VTKPQQKSTIRLWRIAIWIGFASVFLFLYYSRAEFFGSGFRDWAATSVLMGYSLYLLVGAVRGFTLIPATHLILLGIPLFPPAPLFFLSLAGILISSTTVYYFSESLHLSEYFERKHREKILKIQAALRRNPIAIVTTWSFFPLVPTLPGRIPGRRCDLRTLRLRREKSYGDLEISRRDLKRDSNGTACWFD